MTKSRPCASASKAASRFCAQPPSSLGVAVETIHPPFATGRKTPNALVVFMWRTFFVGERALARFASPLEERPRIPRSCAHPLWRPHQRHRKQHQRGQSGEGQEGGHEGPAAIGDIAGEDRTNGAHRRN